MAEPIVASKSGSLTRYISYIAMLAIVLAGVYAADRFARTLEQNQVNDATRALEELARTDQQSVKSALRALDESLSGLSAYLASSDVNVVSFDAMANEALRRNSALRALVYANKQAGATANTATALLSAQIPPTVLERNWLGELVPAAPRASYLPILRVRSSAADAGDYAALMGFDLLSDPDLSTVLLSSKQAVSYRSLVPGRVVISYAKLDADGVQSALLAEFEIASLFGTLSATKSTSNLAAARVFDGSDGAGLKLLFPAATSALEAPGSTSAALENRARRSVLVEEFTALGRKFRVETAPLAAFFKTADNLTPQLVRYGGAGLSALAALLILTLLTRNARIEKLVQIRGHELTVAFEQVRDSELMSMQSEKMSSLGQMVAGVAHEINTPLAYVTSNVELLQDRLSTVQEKTAEQHALLTELHHWQQKTPAQRNAWYEQALEQESAVARLRDRTLGKTTVLLDETLEGLVRVRDLVATLKDFSRVDRAPVDDIDIHQCIENTLKIAHNVVKHKAHIVKDFGNVPHVRCNPSQINQVLLNLITNAAQAMPQQEELGEIKISTRTAPDAIEILIADNGSGIPDEVLEKIFQPFFTTKSSGEGTGLGLAICEKIIKGHGGTISVDSSLGLGTIFTIRLPIAGESVFIV
jgi:signal transduction histidine kinase